MVKRFFFLFIILVFIRCKVHKTKEYLCGNSLPIREGEKMVNHSEEVLIIFEKGFDNTNIKILKDKDTVFDSILTTKKTTGYSGETTVTRNSNEDKLLIMVNENKFKIKLRKTFDILQIQYLNGEMIINYCNGIPYYY